MAADFPRESPLDWLALRSKAQEVFNRSRVFRNVQISGPEADREGRIAVQLGFRGEPAFIRIIASSAETVWAVLFEVARSLVETDASVPFVAGAAERDDLLSDGRETMSTIVEYSDKKPPENLYPWLIVSPTRSGPCCFSEMDEIGTAERNGRWESVYKRCRTCGFAVSVILRESTDAALAAGLRTILDHSLRRNIPDS